MDRRSFLQALGALSLIPVIPKILFKKKPDDIFSYQDYNRPSTRFIWDNNGDIIYGDVIPPFHPNCRCALVFDDCPDKIIKNSRRILAFNECSQCQDQQ